MGGLTTPLGPAQPFSSWIVFLPRKKTWRRESGAAWICSLNMLGGGIGFRLPKSVVSHSSTNHFFFSLPVLLSLRSFLCINKFLCPRPGPETSPSGSPWWLAPLYRRPSADDRRGFPKPGRCIKHNHHGVFPVGLTQSCGSPVSIVCFLLRACWVSFRKTSRPLSFNVFESSKKKYQNIYLKKNFILQRAGC
jgi:hypothetical protein